MQRYKYVSKYIFFYLAWLACRKSVFVGGSVHVGHENEEKQLKSK